MAQIIKHRRGSIDSVKNSTSRKGELIMATGSVGNLNGPFIFIGTDEGSGLYSPASKLYAGSAAPTLNATTYGTTLDGTPFYADSEKSLYILNNSNVGNSKLDLTGNIEGNTISGVTINNLESTNVSASFVSASFVGDGGGLYGIPATGITGLNLSKIYSGSVQVSTDSVSETITLSGGTVNIENNTYINNSTLYVSNISGNNGAYVNVYSEDYSELNYNNQNYMWVESGGAYIETNTGNIYIRSLDGSSTNLNTEGSEGQINIGNGANDLYTNLQIAELSASDYAQLGSNNSYIFVNNLGAHVQNDSGLARTGVTARSNGEVEVTGSLSVGGGYFMVDGSTGDIRTSGSITMKGNITIGDNMSGDTINLNAEISSSLIPSGTLLFDLGSTTNKWNNIYVGTVNAENINLGSVSFSGLTEGRVLLAGPSGSIVDSGSFTYGYNGDYNDNVLEAPIIRASNDGNGTNFLVGNDMWIGDINEANAMMFKGSDDQNQAKVYLGNWSQNNQLYANYNDVTLKANDWLYLQSANSSVEIESYDGTLYLNTDSNNNVRIGGHTYIQNRNLHVDMIWDYSDGSNYLQLYGWNTNDGYWWEGGNGTDTTLLNNYGNANLNVINFSSGNVNIDAENGSVNIKGSNGTNITGSLVVSDGSGLFNSALITNNSNLTLTSGSNLSVENGGTATIDGQADFHGNVYVTGNTYTDDYRGMTNTDNALHMNGGTYGAPNVELVSSGQISLFAEGNGHSGIHLTGSVYSDNNIKINNNNRLDTNNVYGANDNNLNLYAWSDVYIYSQNSRYVEINANNDEDGTNYIWVDHQEIALETYDYTSGLNHQVILDNFGNLNLNNVQLHLTGSLGVEGNTTFNNDLTVGGDMYVSGNFTVLGTGSIITLTGSQIDIGTNKILLNTYAPFERFAGIDVYDSGSNVGVTGSLLWDSQNNVWIYANPSGSDYASARFIAGPKNTGSLGEELGLSNGHFPIATGDDHISDSLLTYIGTTLSLNTNKFTVDSDSGDTLILGNFTIQGAGATDNGEYTSYIVFRNSDDVLGFVDTTDTGNVTDRLLGYNETTGVLEFSSLIDGGTY